MTRDDAVAFAAEWAEAWNERAVDRVLGYFSEDVTFTSPAAMAVVGAGTVRGKTALRAYWTGAMGRIGSLRFAVDRVMWDVVTRELAIIYVSSVNGQGKRVSENLTFGPDGLVVSAEVFHGVSVAP
jgi:ketosteroid isomerase-like protein